MKTIIFFTPQSLANIGGGERILAQIANALSLHYNVKILSPYKIDSYFKYNAQIELLNFDMVLSHNRILRRLLLLKILYKLRRFIIKNEFDYFIAFSLIGTVLSLYSYNIICKGKFYSWLHTSYFHPTSSILQKLFLYRIGRIQKMLVLNTLDTEIYKKYHPCVITLPNPLPIEVKGRSDLKSKRIVSIGRLDKEKGFDYLIDICASVFISRKDWILDIYGQDDGELEHLQKLILEKKMGERIRILPPQEDVSNIYLSGSIFAFTSLFESFGLVLIEANSYGLPIIAFNSPSGIRDIVHDCENGYLIPPFDKIIFANRLIDLMDSYELRSKMGEKGIFYSHRYDISTIVKKWIDVIEN